MGEGNRVPLEGKHRIEQGIAYRRAFQLYDRDGLEIVLTGASAKAQFRRSHASPFVMLEATTSNGKLTIDETNGVVFVLLAGTDTEKLTSSGYYDCNVTLTTGEIIRAFQGPFDLDPRITR